MNDNKEWKPCAVGEERFEKFKAYIGLQSITSHLYSYRHTDEQFFSCVVHTIEEGRAYRDIWIKELITTKNL